MSPQSLRILLQPLLAGDLPAWQGLPAVSVADFDALYGPPTVRREEPLGALPAMRHDYAAGDDGTLAMWSRGGQAVMLAPAHLPSPAVLDTLPAPDAVLAHEILVPGHYAHEYLYCTRGLVLTVAHLVPFVPGVAWLAGFTGWEKALMAGFVLFIPGTLVKTGLAFAALRLARR